MPKKPVFSVLQAEPLLVWMCLNAPPTRGQGSRAPLWGLGQSPIKPFKSPIKPFKSPTTPFNCVSPMRSKQDLAFVDLAEELGDGAGSGGGCAEDTAHHGSDDTDGSDLAAREEESGDG